jgi:RNA polymerase sigma-70 factor (ECF subfamily)
MLRGADAGAPDVLLEREQMRALLDEALLHLDLELREVFVLCDLEEMPMREVADVLHMPPGTVASRLRRARELFNQAAQRLERHCASRARAAKAPGSQP